MIPEIILISSLLTVNSRAHKLQVFPHSLVNIYRLDPHSLILRHPLEVRITILLIRLRIQRQSSQGLSRIISL